ncbi:uncharacterized protein Triagg1_1946 [Trichoderma aggressivum f. europaeum]|uniref:Uncharacterized protein n=1 Tax=Trichoderma aggressivum f. europaeum TaxID=173218 RepID=A0AAE1IJE6_9HYPO|nr:hypothetical protein Triagg1_1946 [Trichoderma aggressivum f. europaeum]
MPCLRGIELSLVIQPDSVLLPEFPHPDASSVHVASVVEASQRVQENDVTSPGLDSPRIQKTAPKASVYVPSAPGSQFWVQYSIHRHPEPSCYLFFKLFMNGRNITSCGIKPGAASGTITRALFEPSDRWHLKQDGMLLKRSGIESRSFCFSPGPDAIAAADDGGLIEVQVFRAKSRRRSTPQLAVHRDQERYGIISPSTGLLEHPEDAIYYEWILQDATEAPFATFCFHYRAWTYLCDLNLVTDNDNSLLYNARLWERFERSRHEATDYSELEDGSTACHAGLDSVDPKEESQILEAHNSLPLLSNKVVTFPTKSFKRRSNSYTHSATLLLLPPVMEEDVFTSSYESPGNERMTAPRYRYLARENHYLRFRRPLPTVNEVPRLE